MNKTMGYILIIVGLSIAVFGIVLIRRTSNIDDLDKVNERVLAEAERPSEPVKVQHEAMVNSNLKESARPSETTMLESDVIDENKVKGDAFEKYVVKKFNKKYFTLKEWRSDKIVDGIYAVSNHYPDLEILFKLDSKGVSNSFAVECKWRKDYYQNAIEWAKGYQLKNYKKYAEDLKIPVFIVIGVGGQPEDPQESFIIPLREMDDNIIGRNALARYKRRNTEEAFFWNYEKGELR